jgi:phospholipid/cholesterol/gamma-HCH transport system substrate-binding protein
MTPPREHGADGDLRPRLTLAGRTALIACFVGTCFAGILGTVHLIGVPLPLTSEYRVSAVFPDAEGVIPESSVTIGGALAGRVEEVGLTPGGARVTMSLLDRWQRTLHDDATAAIRIKSLLGERFVNLDPGTPGHRLLPSGSTLAQRGMLSVELTDVLNLLDAPTRASLAALSGEMGGAVRDRGGAVNAAIHDLRTLVADLEPAAAAVDRRSADVARLVAAADRATRDLAGEQGSLGGLVDHAGTALATLDRNRGPLLGLVDSCDRLTRELSGVLDAATRAGLRDTLQDAPPALGEAASLGSTLAPTVEQLRPGLPSYVELLPELRSSWSFADANDHYVRVLVLGGPDEAISGSNGDRRPAPDVPPPGGRPAAPGLPPRAPQPGSFAGAPSASSPPLSPLWALIFGGM